MVFVDYYNCKVQCDSYKEVNKVLEICEAILNAIILLAYVVLFVWFAILISGNKARFGGALLRQVIIFFTVMILMLMLNFVLDTVLAQGVHNASSIKSHAELISQEKLVSICSYLHTSVEVIFNFVMLAFLIAQPAEGD